MTRSTSCILKSKQMRKMKDEEAPMRTAATIVLGAFRWGLGISSTMCETAS